MSDVYDLAGDQDTINNYEEDYSVKGTSTVFSEQLVQISSDISQLRSTIEEHFHMLSEELRHEIRAGNLGEHLEGEMMRTEAKRHTSKRITARSHWGSERSEDEKPVKVSKASSKSHSSVHAEDRPMRCDSRISASKHMDEAVAQEVDLLSPTLGSTPGSATLSSPHGSFMHRLHSVIDRTHTESSIEPHRLCCHCCKRKPKAVQEETDSKGGIWGTVGSDLQETFEGAANLFVDSAVDAFLQKTLKSSKFDAIIFFLILGNAVTMLFHLQYSGYVSAVSLGIQKDDGSWPNAEEWFGILEHSFNALFVLELLARLAAFRSRFCSDMWNVMDGGLVVATSIQIYVIESMGHSIFINITAFRVIRFTRFVRVLRIVRVMSMFGELRVLVATIVSSFRALIWSMVLLMMVMIISGVLLCQLLQEYIQDSSNDAEHRLWAYRHYGSSLRAVYTMFEITLSGGWPNYARPLVEHISGYYSIFFLVYIWVVVFAIIRIITALFLKETLQCAANDAEMMVQEQMKAKQSYLKKLAAVFRAVDVSGDGKLSRSEFTSIVSHPKVLSWFKTLELEVHDAESLFQLLDDGDGQITSQEFLNGVLRLKGQARSTDVVAILRATDKIREKLGRVEDMCQQSQVGHITHDIKTMCSEVRLNQERITSDIADIWRARAQPLGMALEMTPNLEMTPKQSL